LRAALADAASLAAIIADEFRASYRGERRDVYIGTLARYVADLGGSLEEKPDGGLTAAFEGRRISVRFSG